MTHLLLAATEPQSLSAHFRLLDWVVLLGYLVVVSVLGVWLAGRQKDMEDFFRGGNKLPWYAVSGSMIATIISAVTFVGVPAIVYRDGGDFTYLQFGIIAGLLSRLFICAVLVPAYYKRRVYSPYDYMGRQLGEAARSVTTAMFSLMGLLAQAARVYLTALILGLVLHDHLEALENATGISALVWSVTAVGVIAVIWTLLGGIATVVWTDVMLFLVFVIGGVVALLVVVSHLPGGWPQLFSDAYEAGKFELWSLKLDASFREVFTEPYTIWAAFFAVTFGNIGAYGTDQLLAQRIFTCKSKKDAQIAVMTSWVAEGVVALMLLVGAGLWVFYQQFPEKLVGEGAEAVAQNMDNIFPVFILTQVPMGLTGLIVAGIFAAAISSLTSILAALSQTTLSALYLPLRKIDPDGADARDHDREVLLVSRLLIVVWGVALCLMAFGIDAYVTAMKDLGRPVPFLDLALGLSSYVVGTLLATFLLAWLPLKKDAYGLIWSAPLSVMSVWALRFHDVTLPSSFGDFWTGMFTDYRYLAVCALASVVLLATWLVAAASRRDAVRRRILLLKTAWLVVGCAMLMATTAYFWFASVDPVTGAWLTDEQGHVIKLPIAWPWYALVGSLVAFVFGYLLGEPRRAEVVPVPVEPTEAIADKPGDGGVTHDA